jgi:hypothetical protein
MARETFTAGSSGKSGIDLKELRQLTKDLHGFNPDKALKKDMRKAGEPVAAEARIIAGAKSKSIPPTIKVGTSRRTITVSAGGPGVAIAELMELGNTKTGKRAIAPRVGTFRHPVYAKGPRSSWHWVEQKREAFLMPAAEHKGQAVEDVVGDSFIKAFEESGWKT